MGLLVLSVFVSLGWATGFYAVDFIDAATVDDLKCARNQNNISKVIIRAFRSTGQPDPLVVKSIYNAAAAGFQTSMIDVYLFPCPRCTHGAGDQVSAMMSNLRQSKANFTKIWLDVEDTSNLIYWNKDTGKNRAFMTDLWKASVTAVGEGNVGIYSTYYMWQEIFADPKWVLVPQMVPVWYARYSGGPSFGNYMPFGGWDTPVGKQYEGDKTMCGFGVDLSYFVE